MRPYMKNQFRSSCCYGLLSSVKEACQYSSRKLQNAEITVFAVLHNAACIYCRISFKKCRISWILRYCIFFIQKNDPLWVIIRIVLASCFGSVYNVVRKSVARQQLTRPFYGSPPSYVNWRLFWCSNTVQLLILTLIRSSPLTRGGRQAAYARLAAGDMGVQKSPCHQRGNAGRPAAAIFVVFKG
jgi:hypothetical protein